MDPIDERLRTAGQHWRLSRSVSVSRDEPVRLPGGPPQRRRAGAALPTLLAASLAVGSVLIAAQLLGRQDGARPSDAAATSGSPSSVDKPVGDFQAPLPGGVFALLFDAERNRLWYAAFNISGGDSLIALDASSGNEVARVELPDVEHNGFTSRLALAGDGAIIVSEPYAIVRYDPEHDDMTSRPFELDAEAPATDSSGALAGSWVSSIAVLKDEIFVGRNGVSELTVLNTDLAESRTVPLPRAISGPGDMAVQGDRLFLAPSYASADDAVWVMTPGGDVSATDIRGRQLSSGFGRAVAFGATAFAVGLADSKAALAGRAGSARDRVAPTRDGGLVAYEGKENRLVWVAPDGVVAAKDLGLEETTVTNPIGQPVKTFTKPSVVALAADNAGNIWYVEAVSNQLIRASR